MKLDGDRKQKTQILIFMVSTILSFVLLQGGVLTVSRVSGDSMAPNYKSGNYVLVAKQYTNIRDGDVVILKAPSGNGDYYIKRIIGKANETVSYVNNQLKRNGVNATEPYLAAGIKTNDFTWILNNDRKIPEGSFLVLGDNREVSKDSRSFGLISEDSIVGKVILQY